MTGDYKRTRCARAVSAEFSALLISWTLLLNRHDCLQFVLLGALLVAHPPYSDYN